MRRREGRRHRRLEGLPRRRGPPPGPRHPRPGPLPRHRLVRRGTHRGAPRRPAPPTRRRSHRPSTPKCSGPGSCCCAAPTASTTPNAPNSKPLFEAHPRLRAAWDALGELHGLYLADDKAGALAALDRFTDLYQTGDLPEFYKIVNTLLAAMPRILAWHTAGRPSNGRIEGTNTHNGWALPAGAGLTQAPTGLVSSG